MIMMAIMVMIMVTLWNQCSIPAFHVAALPPLHLLLLICMMMMVMMVLIMLMMRAIIETSSLKSL